MGARQVPRLAALALALVLVPARGDAAPAQAAPASEPVIIVDLRPGDDASRAASRAAFADRLDGITGLRTRRDDGLDAALAGRAGDADLPRAQAAIDEARAAFGALDCTRARPAAEQAIVLLAARQAAGLDDGLALRTAWTYAFLCADHDGDQRAAQVAAARLRALGVRKGDEVGISASTWDRFPEIDAATDREIVEVTVRVPDGSAVWIDHMPVGRAPLQVFVPAGRHVIAAAAPPAAGVALRGAVRVDVGVKAPPVEVPMTDAINPWAAYGERVAQWRRARRPPTAEALGALMNDLRVRFALVLTGDDVARLWTTGADGGKVARPRATAEAEGTMADPLTLAARLTDRVAAWEGRGPDPDQPLIREDRRRGDAPRWWVYASIVGAVLVGGAVIYAQDTAQDHQRIEVEWP